MAATYRTIVAALQKDSAFRAAEYDAELAAYKAAVEQATKAKVAAEQTARDSAALNRQSGPGLSAFVESIKRYAEAQAATVGCAALQ